MHRVFSPRTWTRRRFLSVLGLTTGSLALGSLSPRAPKAGAAPLPATHPLHIGLLLPESPSRPSLGPEIAAGLRLGLAHAARPAQITIAAIGCGTSGVADRFQELHEAGADLVVAATSPTVAAGLRTLAGERRTPVIVADAGANPPRAEETSPYLFHATLAYWQSSWAMGRWAARNLGARGFLAASLYEAGYDSYQAFALGAEAGGGAIAQTHVTPSAPAPQDWAALFAAIRQANPDYLAALYSGPDAAAFLQAYADSGLAGRIPMVGGAFLAEAAPHMAIRHAAPWAPSLNTQAEGQAPDPFALLGYNTGLLIATACRSATDPAARRSALESARFQSPAGPVAMHPATHTLSAPLYLREGDRVICRLDPISERAADLIALRATGRTGWLNGYLNV